MLAVVALATAGPAPHGLEVVAPRAEPGRGLGLWAAVRAYYLASFAGYFLPMTVGADAVRIGALGRHEPHGVLVASVVLERLIGALAQAVLAVAVGGRRWWRSGLGARVGPAERWALGAAVALAFAAFPFSFPVARWVAARLGPGGGWRKALRALAEQYAGYGASTGLLCAFFALTLLEGGFPVAIHDVAGARARPRPGLELLHRHRAARLPGGAAAGEPWRPRVPGAVVRVPGGSARRGAGRTPSPSRASRPRCTWWP